MCFACYPVLLNLPLPNLARFMVLLLVLWATGCETQTNIVPFSSGGTHDVAVSPNSRYVITWSDGSCSNFSCRLYARVYNQGGLPVTGQLLVSPTTKGTYRGVEAAIDDTGAFVIVYGQYIYDPAQPKISDQIFFRRYSPNGSPNGAPQFVGYGTSFDVAMTDAGNFNISFTTSYLPGTGDKFVGVKRYDAAGAQIGAQIIVDSSPPFAGTQIRMNCRGDFIVAFYSAQSAYVRRYFASGAPDGSRILVAGFTYVGLSSNPLIYRPDRSFAFITHTFNPVLNKVLFYLDRYNAGGNMISHEFLWDSMTVGTAQISGNSCGQYALVSHLTSGDIQVRQYTYADTLSASFQANQLRPNLESHFGLSADSLVVAWDRPLTPSMIYSLHIKRPLDLFSQTAVGPPRKVCVLGCIDCRRTATLGSPAVPGYSYSWSPATHLSNPNVAQPTVRHPGGATTFSITYTLNISAPCCQRTETVVVTFERGCL